MANDQHDQTNLGEIAPDALPTQFAGMDQAPWMFWIPFAFLAALSVLLPHGGANKLLTEQVLYHPVIPVVLLVIWAVVLGEAIWRWWRAVDRKENWKRMLLVALVPPFRMVLSPRRPNNRVWLPVYGWRDVSAASVFEMEQRTAIPMLLATALIVPVLVVDFGFSAAVDGSVALQVTLAILMALIWFSFALEFVVMVSLAPKKLAYCKKHWINIVIIILPLVAFLRSLQLFRFLRMTQAGKLVRAYRLRGLITRSLKIALAFNLIERFMSMNPERYAASLEDKIAETEDELSELRQKLAEVQRNVEERADAKAKEGS
ncbi:MAG: hypothetical protein HKN18_11985 [Silicimonas sp.]|nr:hypothetical protein [Silicimonas sp.]